MRLTYDSEANALTVEFRPGATSARMVRVTPEVNIHFHGDGRLVLLEVLIASWHVPHLAADDLGARLAALAERLADAYQLAGQVVFALSEARGEPPVQPERRDEGTQLLDLLHGMTGKLEQVAEALGVNAAVLIEHKPKRGRGGK